MQTPAKTIVHLDQIMTRKIGRRSSRQLAGLPDSLAAWFDIYLDLAVRGVRATDITDKITLHLERFIAFFEARYGHDHISVCLQRDVLAWRDDYLAEECSFAPATVNNHLASLSKCCTWIAAQAPQLFPASNPCSRVKELPLPPLAPHTLSDEQILLMKSLWDRLPISTRKKVGGTRPHAGKQMGRCKHTGTPVRTATVPSSISCSQLACAARNW